MRWTRQAMPWGLSSYKKEDRLLTIQKPVIRSCWIYSKQWSIGEVTSLGRRCLSILSTSHCNFCRLGLSCSELGMPNGCLIYNNLNLPSSTRRGLLIRWPISYIDCLDECFLHNHYSSKTFFAWGFAHLVWREQVFTSTSDSIVARREEAWLWFARSIIVQRWQVWYFNEWE